MNYKGISLHREFCVEELFSLHYFEYMSTFSFPGESHDFWEFICVDKGAVEIGADEQTHRLQKNQIAFHSPGEFHWVKANGSVAPNLIVVSFSCHSPQMNFFHRRILQVGESERRLLALLITEARNWLEGRLDDPYQTILTPKNDSLAGCGQLIQLYLEQLLLQLYRRYAKFPESPLLSAPTLTSEKISKENLDTELYHQVVNYMRQNLTEQITIEKICRDNLVGRSRLQKIFQAKSGLGIISYFSQMKIEAAKQFIRTGQMNFTQISETLGYSSIHYFSRQFKKLTNMTPSEYASSIKALSEKTAISKE